jgi:ATP synthase A1 C subunit
MSVLTARRYAQINAKVRALKSYLLPVGEYERLVQSTTVDDTLRLLSATPYAERIAQVDLKPPYDLVSLDRALSEELLKAFDLVEKGSTGKTKEFIELYAEKFYYDNLKIIVSSVTSKTPKQTALQYIISLSPKESEEYNILLDSQNVHQVIDQVRTRKAREALTAALPQFESLKTPLVFENALDREIYGELWERIKKLSRSDRRYASKIIGTKIDVINILTILRCKALKLQPEAIEQFILPVFYKSERVIRECVGAPNIDGVLSILSVSAFQDLANRIKEAYEADKSIFAIERALNQYLIQVIYSQLLGFPFQIGVPIAYLELKSQEIRNLKIIIVGKVEEIEPSKIRDLLIIF